MRKMRRGLALSIPSGVLLVALAMVLRPAAGIEPQPPVEGLIPAGSTARAVAEAPPVDKAAAVVRPNAKAVVEEPLFKVEVFRRLQLDGATAARYESVAERLSSFSTVPDDRRRQFSGYKESHDFGWAGSVLDVRDPPLGAIVEVWVAPRSSLIYFPQSKYFEHFLVAPDGTITYLRSSDPHGAAGRSPLAAVGI